MAPTISLGTKIRKGKSVARDDGPKPGAFLALLGPPGPRLPRLSMELSTRNLLPSNSVLFNSFTTLEKTKETKELKSSLEVHTAIKW